MKGENIMGISSNGQCGVTYGSEVKVPQRVSELLKSMAGDIAETAQETEKRVKGRLSPVMNDTLPSEKELYKPTEVWPPLFNELRGSLELIQAALKGINQLIDRVEL